jgi:hypothetical protein
MLLKYNKIDMGGYNFERDEILGLIFFLSHVLLYYIF